MDVAGRTATEAFASRRPDFNTRAFFDTAVPTTFDERVEREGTEPVAAEAFDFVWVPEATERMV